MRVFLDLRDFSSIFFFDPETAWLKERTSPVCFNCCGLSSCANGLQLRSAGESEDDVTGTAAETPLRRACFFFFVSP